TVLSGSVMEFSADYPGYWQRTMEDEGVSMAVFLAGSVGSHGPSAGEGGFQGAERMGKALARMLQQALSKTVLTNRVEFGSMSVEVSLPLLNVRLPEELRLRPWVAKRLLPPAKRSFIQVLRISDSIWVSTPCDFSGELAL